MNTKVTVLMYHYVRNLENSRYPKIKGLNSDLFEEQIRYLKKHYNFVSIEDIISATEGKNKLPKKAVLLTFDDCYKDHFTYVFPVLVKHNIKGAFYVPLKCILEQKVLDVNKIHFILASSEDKKELIDEIYKLLDYYRETYDLEENEYYYKKLAKASRFDTEEVIFIKRLLQVELNEELRDIITNMLFQKIVNVEETTFWEELYLTKEQIKCMETFGMHFGSHSYDHYWLNSLTKERQAEEIDLSLKHLSEMGINIDNWTLCYPYGSYNDDTLEILKEKGCKLAFTTDVAVYDILKDNKYEIPRLDTNDLPKSANAEQNKWYVMG
ncbi:polysaccharide deacetylase [Methanococcus maripaludis C5]|uniref:Polysaccharide deacetylase n=1 Tax=Methanococcus maripaludis (strain C5 / ATCC BAA-1333) TaxID=402880 RepID=A4FZC9_METM5|nr:polysaccharide deacetylase family protein [Methanococcus maripaludis]ABO35563.1 polysaccharide deacetylase [Methanococcus maripaludis C5]